MGKKYSEIIDRHQAFIRRQKIFFVATGAPGARLNLSPKGLDSLRLIDANRVVWLNLTGSGNETAAHLTEDDRMTLMFCAFDGDPLILRLYGHARAVHTSEGEWEELIALFPAHPGMRQVILMDVDLVHSSCGFGVPLFEFNGEREELNHWAEKKGEVGIREYWRKQNRLSMDGRPTGVPET
jgi:hypothetical protein